MAAPPTTAAADKAAAIADYCKESTSTDSGWSACCPAHDDTHPSLSIGWTPDRVLLWCHAGCTFDEICAALGLKPTDLFFGERYGHSPITDTYDYVDEYGTLLFQVCRTLDKKFPQRRPDPTAADGWAWKIPGVRRVLYHLPQLRIGIAAGRTIFLPEGEKDVHTVEQLGLVATCNPMGAVAKKGKNKWRQEYSDMLRGAHIAILPDHDKQGAEHAAIVSSHLAGIAASIKIVPGIHTVKSGSDVTDWVRDGGTREHLLAATDAAPLLTPAQDAFHPTAPGSTNGTHPPAQTTTPGNYDPDSLYTDDYNARALVREHGLDLRYCKAWKTWMVWNGTHWERDESGVMMRRATRTIKDLTKLMHAMDKDQCDFLWKHIKASLSTNKLEAMIKSAQSIDGISVKPDDFDRDILLLNCTSGTIDLRTGQQRPHSRTDLLTRRLSITYNPGATCPRWEAFLDRAMQHKQGLVAFLHRAVGYSLTGSTIEQCLFILHGPTKTGKTTFLARLRALLGPYGTQADMDSFMHKDREGVRNDLADLNGARVVCAVEAQEGRRLNEALIKQLTGGLDQIKARFLFEEFFTFVPQFKIFIGTNHKPVIKDSNQAIWERIRLIPFVAQIPQKERDKHLDEALQEELPGILAWAVRGCLDWQQRGDLEPPPEVLNATKEWQDESDVIGRFLDERCVILQQAQVRAQPLWDAYKAWCEAHGETWEKQTAFGIKLAERGFQKKTSNGVVYLGLGLRSDDQD